MQELRREIHILSLLIVMVRCVQDTSFGVHVAGCACSNKSKCTCTKSLFACVTPFELMPLNLSSTADSSSNLLLLRFNHLCCANVQDATTIMITVDCLVELCVCIQIDDALYICIQPNKLESDI